MHDEMPQIKAMIVECNDSAVLKVNALEEQVKASKNQTVNLIKNLEHIRDRCLAPVSRYRRRWFCTSNYC